MLGRSIKHNNSNKHKQWMLRRWRVGGTAVECYDLGEVEVGKEYGGVVGFVPVGADKIAIEVKNRPKN